MSGLTAVDLSQLPAPAVVEAISFEQIFAEMLADLRVRDDTFTALTESDPSYKVLQVAAYREMLLRQRVNDGAKAVMLPYRSAMR
jgi:phage-related baseplate assembly protein